jgi:hypothetical protein
MLQGHRHANAFVKQLLIARAMAIAAR